jgi:sugar lactone lactonase YvrE
LSTDAVIDPSTDTLLGTEVTSVDLAPGGSQSFAQRTLTIPSGTSPGNYFIGISVDRSNAVAEANEGNNSAAVALEVTLPPVTIPGGEIIVSDNTSLHRFSPTGTFNGTIATLPGGGCPHGTVIGPSGDFFVADPCTDTIHKITGAGVISTVYQADPENPEEPLKAPIAIAIDVDGNLIVGDNNVDKLFKLAPDGSSIVEFATLPGPSPTILQDIDIKRDRFGNLVVAYDSFGGGGVASSGAIIRFAPNGTPTAVINGTGAFSVGGLAIKPDGNYVIGDFANDRIVQVTPRGSITVLIASGALDSNLVGMAIDSAGNFISTLNFSNKLLKITLPDTVATLAEGPPIAGPRYVVLYPGVAGLSTITFQDQAVGSYEGGTVTLSAGGVDVTFSGSGLLIRDLGASFPAGASRVLSTAPSDLQPITATLTFPEGVTADFVQIRNWISGVYTPEADTIVMSAYNASGELLGTVTSSSEFISLAFPGMAKITFDDIDDATGYVIDEFVFRKQVP